MQSGNTRPGGILEDQLTRVELLHLSLSCGDERFDCVGLILPLQRERFYSLSRNAVVAPLYS